MNPCKFLDGISWKKFIAITAMALAMPTALFSQTAPRANRITQDVNSGPAVTIAGSVHPLTRQATDLGALDPATQIELMSLNAGLSLAQQTELAALLEAQQNPLSPQYRRWLTQGEYGARFGLTAPDLDKVTGWLTAQGFTVKAVSQSQNAIYFSGEARQVESAFHTLLHRYSLNGETRFANATSVQVPAGIGSVLLNLRGLNNFRIKPMLRTATPEFTLDSNNHFLTPGDWSTIYNVTSVYNAGYDGTGAHVGVVGQTYVPKADIDHFRTAAGLTATKLAYACIDPTASHCTGTTAISTQGDLGEADLDIEWAGGIAKNATVHFVYAPFSDVHLTTNSLNVFDALQYAVQTYRIPGTSAPLPVISMSYGDCEYDSYISPGVINQSNLNFVTSVGQQANAQGQTIVVSSGDSGAAGCDPQGVQANYPAKGGAWVNLPDASPNYTSVGGTTLDNSSSAYWNQTPNQVVTALSYMPEITWNDADYLGLMTSGGGVSTLFPQPSWQQIPYGFTATPGRFVPDVAFAASANRNGYMYCSQDNNSTQYGTMCANGFYSSGTGSNSAFYVAGGTSAAAPSFAGMLTLLTQKYGPLGNANPTLYSLAAAATTYATVFHDIASGNNIVPCVPGTYGCLLSPSGDNFMGWSATVGYDLVTGLGSIDGGALLTALGVPALPATSVSVTETASKVIIGHTTTLIANVSSATAGSITGTVTFKAFGVPIGTAPVTGGTATLSSVVASAANGFKVGADTVTASYGGDTGYAPSFAETTLTVLPLQATTTSLTAVPNALMSGATTTFTATISSTLPGTITGTVSFKASGWPIGTATISGGTATLSNLTANSANFISPGTDTISATYNGDDTFATSSGTAALTVTAIPTTTTVTVTPDPIMFNNPVTFTVTVSAPGGIYGGQLFLTAGGVNFASGDLGSTGKVTWNNVPVNAQNGFSVGTNTITARYYSGGDYASSTGSTTLTVTPQPATTTTIAVNPSSVTIGGTVNLTATVTSTATGTPTGMIIFGNGTRFITTATLSNGTVTRANFPVNAANGFAWGTDSITATYVGDTNFASSVSAATPLTVASIPSTTTLTVTPTSVSLGDSITLNALVSGSSGLIPSGMVNFKLGSLSFGNYSMALGSGSLDTNMILVSPDNGFIVGTNSLTVTYSGDGNFNVSNASTTLTVASAPAYSVTPSATTITLAPGAAAYVSLDVTSRYFAGTITMPTSSSSSAVSAYAPQLSVSTGGFGTSMLTIRATASAANHPPAMPWKSGGAVVFCAVLLGVPFRRRWKQAVAVLLTALTVALVGFLVACGGGGGGSSTPAPRTYIVTVTPTGSGASLNPMPINITVTVQ